MRKRLLPAAAAASLIAGCGTGTAPHSAGAALVVTRDFGAQTVLSAQLARIPGGASDLGLLRRYGTVATIARGAQIASFAGAVAAAGQRWDLFVNGIAPATGPGRTPLNPGDQVWLDLRPSTGARLIPAVVGSFPEPFTTGIGAQQYPTVEDCAANTGPACATVQRALDRVGVKVSSQALGGGSGQDSLSVVVGTFTQLRGVIAAELLQAGPAASGIFAQFVGSGGQVLELDNPAGQVTRTLRGSVGLVAATAQQALNAPTWLVTGTDQAGVAAAARVLNRADLRNRYAVAVLGTDLLGLPVTAGSAG